MSYSGYYRFPTIHSGRIVFVSEDDLWSVDASGGKAERLTSNLGEVSYPCFSPNGRLIAYNCKDEGDNEVYVMPAEGGEGLRLTFLGCMTRVVAWSTDGKYVIFASNAYQPFERMFKIFKVNIEGGLPEMLPVGRAHRISFGRNGETVLGVNMLRDPSWWKRYRGGTAGRLWVDTTGKGEFKKFNGPNGNLSSPMWIGNRIYFISDHEGIGRLYSAKPNGKDLVCHAGNNEYYVRNASTDGSRIVYHAGGELFVYDVEKKMQSKINVEYKSPRIQRQRKFVDAAKYLESYHLHPEGHSLCITSRAKSFYMGNWEGAVNTISIRDGSRYRLSQWLNNGKKIITVSDIDGNEAIEIHDPAKDKIVRINNLDLGRILTMKISPDDKKAAVVNHRHELWLVDLDEKTAALIDKSDFFPVGFDWSPDSQWIVYNFINVFWISCLKIYNTGTGKCHPLTKPDFRDLNPSFDPEGRFVYFLSYREFNPVYDSTYFDLNFPMGVKPYLITLRNDIPSPFIPQPKTPGPPPPPFLAGQRKPAESTAKIEIDFEGIERRVVQFPVPERKYSQIAGLKGKVLFSHSQVEGSLNKDPFNEQGMHTLELYDFELQQTKKIADEINDFTVSSKTGTLAYKTANKVRVRDIESFFEKNGAPANDKCSRETGWVDLGRIKISIEPPKEWNQMYREAWTLQKDHFWVKNMGGVKWNEIYERYLPLIDKIGSRSEFSDLIWEMQGELGTSHAYESGGDYRQPPAYNLGHLGIDVQYDDRKKAYLITHIVNGDSWNEKGSSSLDKPGIHVSEGDYIIAIAGQRVNDKTHPFQALVNRNNCEEDVTVEFAETGKTKTFTVKTLPKEFPARYREWVEKNRAYVHAKTKNRVGYIHIPDMGPWGYSEFHRYYLTESANDGLLIDVRGNGGGHVSGLLLEKLAGRRIGFDFPRWGKPVPYPPHAPKGPMVALTDEHAGSDGDNFSHCFKLMGLGKLVGKRTWGGVVGIWPRHRLVDKSLTTQPEYAGWFKDVGWGLENYGTDPDIEVDIRPQDWRDGKDPQLDKAIEVVMKELKNFKDILPGNLKKHNQ